jgi:hypothetical protein
MNRKERRAKEALFAKQVKQVLKTNDWGDWENKSLDCPKFKKENLKGFFANSIYSVQVYEIHNIKLLGIRRHDQSSNIPWSHKQRIKNEILGENVAAIEVFPSESELVDQANMFWIWQTDVSFSLKEMIK